MKLYKTFFVFKVKTRKANLVVINLVLILDHQVNVLWDVWGKLSVSFKLLGPVVSGQKLLLTESTTPAGNQKIR